MTFHFCFLLYLVVILCTMFAVFQMFFNKRIIYMTIYKLCFEIIRWRVARDKLILNRGGPAIIWPRSASKIILRNKESFKVKFS